jgi:hypothetical protein
VSHRNPKRSPLFCYGDTPLGTYRLVRILPSGRGTAYDSRQYGPHGVIVLDALAGDAALAEANGRFHIFIQGGALGRGGRLRSTNGCLRLFDTDLKTLIARIKSMGAIVCECIEAPEHLEGKRTVAIDNSYDEGDPPAVLESDPMLLGREFSRRSILVASAVAVGGIAFGGTWFGRDGGVKWVESGPPEAVAQDYGTPPPQGATGPEGPATQPFGQGSVPPEKANLPPQAPPSEGENPSSAKQQLENVEKNTQGAPSAPTIEEQKQQSEFNTQGGSSGAPAVNVPPAGGESVPAAVQNDATYHGYESQQKDLQNQAQQVQQHIDAIRAKEASEPENKSQLQLEESNLKQQRSDLENRQNFIEVQKRERAKQIIQGAPIIKPSGGSQ